MEGVSTVMPMALSVGQGVLKSALSGALAGSRGTETSELAEARAQAAEGRARRQADVEERQTRERAGDLREDQQHRSARARVAQAGSGLALSGTSLLNLSSLEHAQAEDMGRLLGDSARRVSDILTEGAEQARSIRLSGQRTRVAENGLGSLLRLGSQVFKGGAGIPFPTTIPTGGSGPAGGLGIVDDPGPAEGLDEVSTFLMDF